VLWLGTTDGETTTVVACCAPVLDSGPGHVHIDESAVADVTRGARRHGLGVVCQVHSHPGTDTRHSDGDDRMILMPFNGMFSLVVGEFGRGSADPGEGAGLHQYQDGVWIKVPASALSIVPAFITPDGLRR
jgi:proteasome lid subunit RPN8/RPN11